VSVAENLRLPDSQAVIKRELLDDIAFPGCSVIVWQSLQIKTSKVEVLSICAAFSMALN